MTKDCVDYDYCVSDNSDVVKNKSSSKKYKTQKKTINFDIPLADMLSKEDIKKLKMIE